MATNTKVNIRTGLVKRRLYKHLEILLKLATIFYISIAISSPKEIHSKKTAIKNPAVKKSSFKKSKQQNSSSKKTVKKQENRKKKEEKEKKQWQQFLQLCEQKKYEQAISLLKELQKTLLKEKAQKTLPKIQKEAFLHYEKEANTKIAEAKWQEAIEIFKKAKKYGKAAEIDKKIQKLYHTVHLKFKLEWGRKKDVASLKLVLTNTSDKTFKELLGAVIFPKGVFEFLNHGKFKKGKYRNNKTLLFGKYLDVVPQSTELRFCKLKIVKSGTFVIETQIKYGNSKLEYTHAIKTKVHF